MTETQEVPVYRLLAPFYTAADQYIYHLDANEMNVEIEYNGTPNPQMEPLNQAARDRMREYINGLPSPIRTLDSVVNDAYMARPRHEAEQISQTVNRQAPKVMGNLTKEGVQTQDVPVEGSAKAISRAPTARFGRAKRVQGTIKVG